MPFCITHPLATWLAECRHGVNLGHLESFPGVISIKEKREAHSFPFLDQESEGCVLGTFYDLLVTFLAPW